VGNLWDDITSTGESWINDGANTVENAWNTGVRDAGGVADGGLNLAARGADALGWHGMSNDLRNVGDDIVDATGGQVPERQLGQTQDPTKLIRGEPAAIDTAAKRVRAMGDSVGSTGDALRRIDTGEWSGGGEQAFHAVYS
jgi:hypothetical protein